MTRCGLTRPSMSRASSTVVAQEQSKFQNSNCFLSIERMSSSSSTTRMRLCGDAFLFPCLFIISFNHTLRILGRQAMEQKNVHHSFCPLRLLGHALYRFVSLQIGRAHV